MSLVRLFYLLLIGIAGYSAYYLYMSRDADQVQVAVDTELPAFSGEYIDNTNYNVKGVRSYRVTADSLEHYSKSGNTVFNFPVLHVFKKGEVEEWQITADKGILDEKQILTLYDNVQVKNLLPEASFDNMKTDKLFIQLDNRDFWADNPVFLVGPMFETKGEAMKGNLSENIATLFNNVKGKYEILTP